VEHNLFDSNFSGAARSGLQEKLLQKFTRVHGLWSSKWNTIFSTQISLELLIPLRQRLSPAVDDGGEGPQGHDGSAVQQGLDFIEEADYLSL
jgi:hypothetical protein